MAKAVGNVYRGGVPKKTRQGCSRLTKYGHKGGKRYVKKYRGQGGRKR